MKKKDELSIYMPDKIHLSAWLNRHVNPHKFETEILELNYDQIVHVLETPDKERCFSEKDQHSFKLNQHNEFRIFETEELDLKFERIGYHLKTGEVIYIRNGQYDQIKDKIPRILFGDPQKNLPKNFKK